MTDLLRVIFLVILVLSLMIPGGMFDASAVTNDGSVDSTVEINDSTTNGPELTNADWFGYSIANIGDLDGNGINDLAVGAYGDDGGAGVGNNSGAVHLLFLE